METPYVDYTEFYQRLENEGIKLDPLEDLNTSTSFVTDSTPTQIAKSTPITKKTNPVIFTKLKDNSRAESKKTEKIPSQKEEITTYIKGLDIDDNYKNYLIKLAQRESNFNPNIVNKQGYKGLFQMGDAALQDVGMTTDEYMSDWKNQINAIIKYTDKHKSQLSTIINSNVNRNWNGIPLTEYGILGAAHLGGAKGLTNLLLKGIDKKDSNQTAISDYLTYFSS